MEQRICRRCLLRELPEKELFEGMYQYIRNLPEEDKVQTEEYERRLSICKSCSRLLNGMCTECGCYVELRAVMAIRHCPLPTQSW